MANLNTFLPLDKVDFLECLESSKAVISGKYRAREVMIKPVEKKEIRSARERRRNNEEPPPKSCATHSLIVSEHKKTECTDESLQKNQNKFKKGTKGKSRGEKSSLSTSKALLRLS